jgi:hypothetical protein
MKRDFLQFSDDSEIVLRQEGMKIFKNKNGRLDLLDDLIECSERIFGGGVSMFL